MALLPELNYCCECGEWLGPENFDGICLDCEEEAEQNEQEGV